MRARAALLLVGALVLASCTTTAAPPDEPRLGGPATPRHQPPAEPMSPMEKPVAARLAGQLRTFGLTLAYLDCPSWDGKLPHRLRCRAFVDGLVAEVAVRLHAGSRHSVTFDAHLRGGVVVTRTLESTLREQGWAAPDCGARAAYAARVGDRVVCRVRAGARTSFVVAEVRSRSGAVAISDHPGASPTR